MSALLAHLAGYVRARIEAVRKEPDAGYSTESVLVTALFVALALIVIGIIAAKVIAKANSIDLE